MKKVCGYRPGQGAPSVNALLYMANDLGLEVKWIEDIGDRSFKDLTRPDGFWKFLRETCSEEAYLRQRSFMSDAVEEHCQNMKNYHDAGYHFENRPGTIQDMKDLMQHDDALLKLAVDGAYLFPQTGQFYEPYPHVILGHGIGYLPVQAEVHIDYDASPATRPLVEGLYYNNPDGVYGNIRDQISPWPELARARAACNNRRQIMAVSLGEMDRDARDAVWLAHQMVAAEVSVELDDFSLQSAKKQIQ